MKSLRAHIVPLAVPVTLSLFMSAYTWSAPGDLGFRFKDGKCVDPSGREGLNGSFLGQCAQLKEAILGGLDLSGKDFRGSDLREIDFRYVILKDANFSYTKLQGAKFQNVDLDAVDFSKSDLSSVTIHEAVGSELNFTDSILTGASITRSQIPFSTFLRANLQKSQVVDNNLAESNFSQALANEANFERSDLGLANMNGAQIKNGQFELANLSGAQLQSVKAKGAKFLSTNFRKANLQSGDFTQANFMRAKMDFCVLNEAKLLGADLRGAYMADAQSDDAELRGAIYDRRTVFKLTESERIQAGMIYKGLFEFTGVKNNLALDQLEGWNTCYQAPYQETPKVEEIVKKCDGRYVMIACRLKNDPTLKVAAYGVREQVFKDTGRTREAYSESNGVHFYFNASYSMGFVALGSPINKTPCDVGTEKSEQRVCFHAELGGFRCGAVTGLNSDTRYEKLILTSEER